MNIQAFARTVKSDSDWNVSVSVGRTNGQVFCSVSAWHNFGGIIYLGDGFFTDSPADALRALDDAGLDYSFTNSTSSALLAELGLLSGDPEPVQSVEQPEQALSTETVDNSCSICGKTNFDTSTCCKKACVFSPAVGDWVCFSPLRNGGSYVSI